MRKMHIFKFTPVRNVAVLWVQIKLLIKLNCALMLCLGVTKQKKIMKLVKIESRLCNDLGLKNKGFRMGHLNIQGISNKIDQVSLLLGSEKNQIHVLGLSESKLNTNHPDSAFEINGYQKPFRRDRELNSGGGLLVYVMDGVCCNRRTDLEQWNLECIWLEIKPVNSKSFLLGNIYRPPNSTVEWNAIRAFSLYKTGSGFRYQIFSQLAEKIPN